MPGPKRTDPNNFLPEAHPFRNTQLGLSIEIICFSNQIGGRWTRRVGGVGRGKGRVSAGWELLEERSVVKCTVTLDPRGCRCPQSTSHTSRGTRQRSQVTSLQLHSSRVPAGVEPGLSVCQAPQLLQREERFGGWAQSLGWEWGGSLG